MHLPQVAEGNGLLLACATSASRIRLWPVCCHYEGFSALEIVDRRLSFAGEVSSWIPADLPVAVSGREYPWNGNCFRRRNGIKIDAKTHKLRKTMFGLDRIMQHGIEDGYCLPVTQKFRVQAQTFKFG